MEGCQWVAMDQGQGAHQLPGVEGYTQCCSMAGGTQAASWCEDATLDRFVGLPPWVDPGQDELKEASKRDVQDQCAIAVFEFSNYVGVCEYRL